MYLDVIELRDFYSTLLGAVVVRQVGPCLAALGGPQPSDRVLGFGFATPFLGPLRGRAERVLAFMPAGQGVLQWPADGPSATALVHEDQLPLADSSLDWVYLVHALEMSQRPEVLMEEVRRVLAPGGRVVAVVPNRQGPWARSDRSPFGFGRPYSRGQVKRLFFAAGFEADRWRTALHVPPARSRSLIRAAAALDRVGAELWPAFSGVICVRAMKQTGHVAALRRRRALAPSFSPALNPNAGVVGRSAL
ncbi:class I SAM-dependent methyltransferase [Propylenella binzhouense]|nr:methyltransferase domain-containing protein [Propylenella binzhouense]